MNDTHVRIGHFSPDAPAVNVIVDGDTFLENVSFRDISDFSDLSAGSYDVEIVPVGGEDAVIEARLDFEADTHYTVLAMGELDAIDAMVLTDEFDVWGDERTIDDDESMLRLIHLSPDAPTVDVRVVDGPTLFRNVEFGDAAEFETVDAGRYDLEVVPAGDDDAVLSLSDLSLDGGSIYTAIALGTLADDSLDAMLIEDVRTGARKGRPAAGR